MVTAVAYAEPVALVPAPQGPPAVAILEARTYSEIEAAARLVMAEYFRKGFLDRHDDPTLQRIIESMENCRTYLLLVNEEPVITLSYTMTQPLPMETDDLFGREIQPLRARGLRLAELTKLAGCQKDKGVSLSLMTHVCAMAASESDVMTMTVHHRHHHAFYTRLCGFAHLTKEVKPHPSVKGTLAYGLYGFGGDVLNSPIFKAYFRPGLQQMEPVLACA